MWEAIAILSHVTLCILKLSFFSLLFSPIFFKIHSMKCCWCKTSDTRKEEVTINSAPRPVDEPRRATLSGRCISCPQGGQLKSFHNQKRIQHPTRNFVIPGGARGVLPPEPGHCLLPPGGQRSSSCKTSCDQSGSRRGCQGRAWPLRLAPELALR